MLTFSFLMQTYILFASVSLDEANPCEELDCAEYEWCGKKDGVYGCFCDEHHHRPNNESYGESNNF